MKLVIERSELARALGHVTSVVEKRTTIPILSNVMIRATGSAVMLKATDLEREVVEQAPAQVGQPGAVTVPAHMLHDIVRKLPDGAEVELKLDAEKQRVTISAGSSRFALQTLPAEDFPDLAAGEFPHTFEIPAHDLKRLIDKTKFAISTEETRYYLNGIYLHPASAAGDKPLLRAVATDGHRLALLDLERPTGATGMPGIIIPRKTVHELHRLIEASTDNVAVSVSPAKVRFEMGTVTLTSKLIDGQFPDYNRVIPQNNNKTLVVPNGEFIAAVDRVSTIASDRGRAVKLALDKGTLTLSVSNPEGGSATEAMPVDFGGGALDIGFNARYLLDIAGQLDSDTAQFKLADAGAPTIIRDGDDQSALYVLMPMRV